MEKILSGNDWLCVCSKDQDFYHIVLSLYSYVLILIKHDEKARLFDQFLGWLHWKSEFT